MQHSTNYNMNKPERADQYNIDHWNDNTNIVDTELKRNADAIITETERASNAENSKNNKITVTDDSTDLTDSDTFDETSAGSNPTTTKRRTMLLLFNYLKTKFGTASLKNAGNGANQVPYNSSALTSKVGGILCADATGVYNSGKTISDMSKANSLIGICNTVNILTDLEVNIPGFALYEGVKITVFFKEASRSTSDITLNVNSTGKKGIYVYKEGHLRAMKLQSCRMYGTSEFSDKMRWDENTFLDFTYLNGKWVVIGNPKVIHREYDGVTGEVYADGKIEQWGTFTYSTIAKDFLVSFTQKPSMVCTFNSDSSGYPQYKEFPRPISATQWKQIYGNASVSNGTWYAVGY